MVSDAQIRVSPTACPPQDGLAVARGEAFYVVTRIRVVQVQRIRHRREAYRCP